MSAGSAEAGPIAAAPIRTSSPCGVIGCGHRPGVHVLLDTGAVVCEVCLNRTNRAERRLRDWKDASDSHSPQPRVPQVEPRHAFTTQIRALVRGRASS